MTKPERPFRNVPAEQLDAEIERLVKDRSALGAKPKRFKTDAQAAVDRSVEAARTGVSSWEEKLSVHDAAHAAGTAMPPPAGLADAYILATVPEVAARWHERIDAAQAGGHAGAMFAAMDRPEYEAERDRLAAGIEARRAELRYRDLERTVDEANRELGAM